ncbi:hypothetical protein ZWY2020_005163 [Hordeum vulgare]|nr:hypothetical protein ZWY2020_005163 [Hordeum vulgare]
MGGSETSSFGGVPSIWSTASSPIGSSRAAVDVAGSVASGGVSEDSIQVPTIIGGGGGAATSGSSYASRIPDSRIFPEEVWQRGEPEMRPEHGRVLIACTTRMAALERAFLGRALYAVIIGQPRSKVTSEALAAALEFECGILSSEMKVEVTGPPFHFFVQFHSLEDCTRVVHASEQLRCGGSGIGFRWWSRWSRGKPLKLPYKTTLSLEGLSEEAWDQDTVNLVLAGVDGELIDMLPAIDKWLLHCMAWLRNPSAVPKVLIVFVPAPPVQPWMPDSDDENAHSPPRPLSPTDRGCIDLTVIMHVKEVIDRGPLLTEGLADEFLPDEGIDLTRKHTFPT